MTLRVRRMLACYVLLLLGWSGTSWADSGQRAAGDSTMLGVGIADVRLHDGLDWPHGLEFHVRFRPLWTYRLAPLLGISATSAGASFVYAAVERDFALGARWLVIPGLGLGSFRDGGKLELGSGLQFRSALAINLRLQNAWRVGLAVSHISNAGVAEHNPGTEELSLSVSVPFPRRHDVRR